MSLISLMEANKGFASVNFFLVKYDPTGSMIWAKAGAGTGNNYCYSISANAEGNACITGKYTGPSITFGSDVLSGGNFYVAKLDVNINTGISNLNNNYKGIGIYPNPSAGSLCFNGVNNDSVLQVYNVLGEMVYTSITNSSNYWINLNNRAKGVYFYRVTGEDNFMQEGKVVLQ